MQSRFCMIACFVTWRLNDLTLISLRINNVSRRSVSRRLIQPQRSHEAWSVCIIHGRSHASNLSSIIFGSSAVFMFIAAHLRGVLEITSLKAIILPFFLSTWEIKKIDAAMSLNIEVVSSKCAIFLDILFLNKIKLREMNLETDVTCIIICKTI